MPLSKRVCALVFSLRAGFLPAARRLTRSELWRFPLCNGREDQLGPHRDTRRRAACDPLAVAELDGDRRCDRAAGCRIEVRPQLAVLARLQAEAPGDAPRFRD